MYVFAIIFHFAKLQKKLQFSNFNYEFMNSNFEFENCNELHKNLQIANLIFKICFAFDCHLSVL